MDYNNDQPIKILSAAHKFLPNRSQWKRGIRCGSAAAHLYDFGFESGQGHGRLSLVIDVFC